MPELWMPGAERHPLPDTAPTDRQYPSRVIAHVTWSSASFDAIRRYFADNPEGRAKAPHLLWDPFTGEVWQFYPADSRSKSVADKAGGTRTNRTGRYCIQIEAHFRPGHTYAEKRYDRLDQTPCKDWADIQRWTESLGIPSTWPEGMPNFRSDRNSDTWTKKGGWYGHSQVPENTHTDPGPWPPFRITEEDEDVTPEQLQQGLEQYFENAVVPRRLLTYYKVRTGANGERTIDLFQALGEIHGATAGGGITKAVESAVRQVGLDLDLDLDDITALGTAVAENLTKVTVTDFEGDSGA